MTMCLITPSRRMTSKENIMFRRHLEGKKPEEIVFDIVTSKIGMDKNGSKLLEKEKLQIYRIDKIVHDYCYIKLYSIKRFQRKKFDWYDKLNKSFMCSFAKYLHSTVPLP